MLLVVVALAAYLPALNGGFVWDDDAYVVENPNLRTPDGLWKIWATPTASPQYYPVAFTSFWLEYRLWGPDPLGYHLTNVLLHALNGVLVWRLLLGLQIRFAWFIAAAFVLHPVHVESVAWVTERKNVLSGFFYLSAALAFFQFRPVAAPSAGPPRWGWYAAALGLYACALLSKTVTCSLPAALLLVLWWKSGTVRRRDVLILGPLFALGLVLAGVTIWMERTHVGARGADWTLSAVDRCLIAGRALWFYLGQLCWPANLVFIYPRWHIDAGEVWQYVFPLAYAGAVAVAVLGRRRWGRGPAAALLFFAGTLVPALGFIDVYPMRFSFVADHFQYLASLGALVLLVEVGARALGRLVPDDSPWRTSVAGLVLVALMGLTFQRGFAYENLETLWTDTLAGNPDCWLAHNNLGEVRFEQGRIEEARVHYREAARLKPEDPQFHYNLGKAEWTLGNVEAAISEFEEATRLDPNYETAHLNLGIALRRKGLSEEGLVHIERAVQLKPDFPQARNALGVALAQKGRRTEAIQQFLAAAESSPSDPESHYNLALTYAQSGEFRTALAHAKTAVDIRPNDPRLRSLFESLRRDIEKR